MGLQAEQLRQAKEKAEVRPLVADGRASQCSYLQYLVGAKVWLNPLWAELLGRAHACIRRVPFKSGFGRGFGAIPAIANGVVSSFWRSP